MGLLPGRSALTARGGLWIFRGLRTGSQGSLFVGFAVVAYSLWKKYAGPDRELLHRETLRGGESLVVQERSGDGGEVRRVTVVRPHRGEA